MTETDDGIPDPLYQGSLCWSVDGAAGESFVFGSVHQMDSDRIRLPLGHLESLLDATGALCIEVDAEGIEQATVARESLMVDPTEPSGASGGRGIRELLDDGYRRRLVTLLEKTDSGSEMVPMLGMLPVSLISLMAMTAVQQSSVFFGESDLEIEKHFLSYAGGRGYPVHALETLEEQLAWVVQDRPVAEQVEELKKIIDGSESPDAIDMYRRYANQDLRLLEVGDMRSPEMSDRNSVMGERLATLLTEQRMLVIVGVAHLPYDTGVLAELERRGLRVSPHPVEVGAYPAERTDGA